MMQYWQQVKQIHRTNQTNTSKNREVYQAVSRSSVQSITIGHRYPRLSSGACAKGICASLIVTGSMMMTGCWHVAVIKQPASSQLSNSQLSAPSSAQPSAHLSSQASAGFTVEKVGTELLQAQLATKQNNLPSSKRLGQAGNAQPNQTVKDMAIAVSVLGESVSYDTSLWGSVPVTPLDIATVGNTPEELAKVISTDENSLDYASYPAVKYRFMKHNAPYFDLVNSTDYLELGWHYANPSDTESVKSISISHAHQAHKFARRLMGDEGGKLVADILAGQKVKNREINGVYVSLAKCEFYGCVLVMKKPALPPQSDGLMTESEAVEVEEVAKEEVNVKDTQASQ